VAVVEEEVEEAPPAVDSKSLHLENAFFVLADLATIESL
jgi:hypothetical protein